MTELVTTRFEGEVLVVGINRPERKNALTLPMYQALAEALSQTDLTKKAGAVVLHGGSDCFSAGFDLAELGALTEVSNENHPVIQFMRAMRQCPLPILAAVSGKAVGIGATLLLHCDLVYAKKTASLRFPFVDLGLVPEFAASYLLPRLCGYGFAAETLLMAEEIPAEVAQARGIIHYLVNDPLFVALNQAKKLSTKPRSALISTKRLLREANEQVVSQTIERENKAFSEALSSEAFGLAVKAFFQS